MEAAGTITSGVAHALDLALSMSWEILWALILGFGLSAAVQAVVSKSEMVRLLPDDSPRTLAIAGALGIASSSCSYAAVALARSIFRKGGSFVAAMAFEFASTNLVIELGVILGLLMGWQFVLAEFLGGVLMIAILAGLFRLFLRDRLIEEARRQSDRGLLGAMEGHAVMDMSVSGGSVFSRLVSGRGITAISHYFVMDWAAIWKDVLGGLLIAGTLGAWVPESFWRAFFAADHPLLAKLWGPLIGPIVAALSFVCSIGNIPLAAVLWNGGISFGGVTSFIYADLIVLPILNIYRKYYGLKMTGFLLATFYAAMVIAGYVVEIVFGVLGLIPDQRNARVVEASVQFNYTSVLNTVFLIGGALLVARAIRTGVVPMLREMDAPMEEHGGHGHQHETGVPGSHEAGTYTCPMHPEIVSDQPGRCPKCGMALVGASGAATGP
jgi:uncharacterized membrane protein YraQ (UPF0718 family)